MQITNAIASREFPAARKHGESDPQLDRDVAELKRRLISGELSDSERANLQSLLRQAERALDNGREQVARRFIDQATDTLGEDAEAKGAPGKTIPSGTNGPPEGPDSPEAESRVYQDASNDTSVSLKYPTKLNEYQAAVAVPAHENEHVQSAVFEAQNNGVLARVQVRYKYGIDASGKRYLKGGNTYASIPRKTDFRQFGPERNSRLDITV